MVGGKKRKQVSSSNLKLKHRQSLDIKEDDDAFVDSFQKRARATTKRGQEDDEFVSSNLSSKILKEALEQQQEIEQEEASENKRSEITPSFGLDSGDFDKYEDDDENDSDGGVSEACTQFNGDIEIDPEDERILEAFMKPNSGPEPSLADIISKKIKENNDLEVQPKMDQSIVDLYKGVGKLLSRYTAGKVPKAFKHIPSLECWEDVLLLTEPSSWSPCAMYQATKVFASNFGVKKAQIFYKLVLLKRVREDIRKNKRLHDSLYQSLKKSLYKPAAFFKGILLPLCQSGTCTLREAVIIGSVIQKVSIPPLHSSVALMKLAELEYCGTTSYFIKLFLDKKYALPYRVLDSVVTHFLGFMDDQRVMPVIWHQSLLSLVQRYKNELTSTDKRNLNLLVQRQKHHLVTPEIKRELKNSRNRGEKEDDFMSTNILFYIYFTSFLLITYKPLIHSNLFFGSRTCLHTFKIS